MRGSVQLPDDITYDEYCKILKTLEKDEQFPASSKAAYIAMLEQQWARTRFMQMIGGVTKANVGAKRVRTAE